MRFDVRKQTEIEKPPGEVYRFIATDHAMSHPRGLVTYTLQPAAAGTIVDFDGRFEAPGPQFLAGLVKGTIDRQVTDGQRRIKQLVEAGA